MATGGTTATGSDTGAPSLTGSTETESGDPPVVLASCRKATTGLVCEQSSGGPDYENYYNDLCATGAGFEDHVGRAVWLDSDTSGRVETEVGPDGTFCMMIGNAILQGEGPGDAWLAVDVDGDGACSQPSDLSWVFSFDIPPHVYDDAGVHVTPTTLEQPSGCDHL